MSLIGAKDQHLTTQDLNMHPVQPDCRRLVISQVENLLIHKPQNTDNQITLVHHRFGS